MEIVTNYEVLKLCSEKLPKNLIYNCFFILWIPSISELTMTILNIELTNLGSETSIYLSSL